MSAAVLMAAMLLNACTSWHAVTGTVPAAVETTQADVLRVALRDGSVLYVRDAHISADSLMGTTARRAVVSSRATPEYPSAVYVESIVKVPVTDVQSVSVSRVNTGRTILAVTGAIAVGFLLLAIIALSTMEIGFGSAY